MEWLSLLRCPKCAGDVVPEGDAWACAPCGSPVPRAGRVPDLLRAAPGTAAIEDDYEEDPGRRAGRLRRLYNRLRRGFETATVAREAERLGRPVDVLDVGSGDPTAPGSYHAGIMPFARVYLGLEPSLPIAAAARPTERVGVARASGELGVVREAAFDVALCFSALDHCADPQLVLANMALALRPGGCAIVDGKNARAWYRPLYDRSPAWLRRRVAPHEHAHPWNFSPRTIRASLGAVGLAGVETLDVFYLAPFVRSPRLDWVAARLGDARSLAWLGAVDRVGRAVGPGRGGVFIARAEKEGP